MKNLNTPLVMTSRKPFDKTTYELRTAANYVILESRDRQYLEDIMTACNAHDKLVEALQHIEQRIDNLRAAGNIPMPDSLRVLALGESLESLQEEIKEALAAAGVE